jgi:hypothetical protein
MRGLRTGHVTAVADRPLRKVLRMAGPAGPIRLSLHRRAAIATASQWMAVRTTTAHGHPIVCLVDTHAQARAHHPDPCSHPGLFKRTNTKQKQQRCASHSLQNIPQAWAAAPSPLPRSVEGRCHPQRMTSGGAPPRACEPVYDTHRRSGD